LGNLEILEVGALDGLSQEEIEALHPREEDEVLVSRLRDGRQVKLRRDKIEDRLKLLIREIEDRVDLIGLLCTGKFEGLSSRKLLVEPSLILTKVVESLNAATLGILIPDPAQEGMTLEKWRGKAKEIVIRSLSPYESTKESFAKVAPDFKECDLIVLDCIGYSLEVKRTLSSLTGKPVILPRTLMARVIGELAEG